MSRYLVIDEIHLTFSIPISLNSREQRSVRRILNGPVFQARLARTVRSAVGQYAALERIRLIISR